jgi:hypothetical protein
MADAKTVADATDQKLENKDQLQKDNPKLYEESVVKEIISQRDSLKNKLREIEAKAETDAQTRQAEELKKKGDYETLTNSLKEQTDKQSSILKTKVVDLELAKLATKHNLIKSEYLSIFDRSLVKIDAEYNLENADELEKSFEKFKVDNPTLFKTEDKKSVPKTDNLPFRKYVQENKDTSKLKTTSLAEILAARGVNK